MPNSFKAQAVDIIVIEDDPNDIEFILHALKEAHVEGRVHVLSDGEDALDYLFHRGPYANTAIKPNPGVIVLDLKIPKINGHDVLKAIKQNQATNKIPVVILTSSSEESDVKSSYEVGANSYIVKPVNFEEFLSVFQIVRTYWVNTNYRP